MTTTTAKPTVTGGGLQTHDGSRRETASVCPQHNAPRAPRQDSSRVAFWRRTANIAVADGDREGYWCARRLMLLAQAAEYMDRMAGER